MAKEVGRFLMQDGRIHVLSVDTLENGTPVHISVHIWPNGHLSECTIFHTPGSDVEQELSGYIEEQFSNGNYLKSVAGQS